MRRPAVPVGASLLDALAKVESTEAAPPPILDRPAQEPFQEPVTIGLRPVFAFAPPRPRTQLGDPFLEAWRPALDEAGDGPLTLDPPWGSDEPLALDVESYPNFFAVCLKNLVTGARLAFERSARSALNPAALRTMLARGTVVTFNGANYDMPMIAAALDGADEAALNELSRQIISNDRGGLRSLLGIDHIDLFEVNPSVRQGLKVLHGRLHGRYMVDLPFAPNTWLTPAQMNVVTAYCLNDLDATEGLWRALREPLALREALSREYGMDLRSRSDAQIGEAIVIRRFEGIARRRVQKVVEGQQGSFRYEPAKFIDFTSVELQDVLKRIASAEFTIDGREGVAAPQGLKDIIVKIGAASYAMGIGGLHSQEANRTIRSNNERVLIDVDVSSQYPMIISQLGTHPPALGPEFIDVYSTLIAERIAAKAAGYKTKADGLKLSANGVYGKLGSPYSPLYSPRMMIATTLTGQLSLLMLIERAEAAGIEVVSGNTDGVTFLCPRAIEEELHDVVSSWEYDTGFSVEWQQYRSLHNQSVNSYIAIREDGKVKRKGPLADPWSEGDLRGQMSKNPQMTVVSEAVVRYLRDGAPAEATVASASDPRAFVTVIKATGGATWRGTPLGRVVRYYWSLDSDPILYADSGRRVAKTEGARPMLGMTDRVPADIDRPRYIAEARKWLTDLGASDDGGLFR